MGQQAREPTPTLSALHLFGAELRRARERAQLTLAALCDQFRLQGRALHRGYLSHVELGERLPEDREFAEIADRVLELDGLLSRLWEFADSSRSSMRERARLSRAAVAEQAVGMLTPVLTGDIVHVPYLAAPDIVAYMQMTRRAFLAIGGRLVTISLTTGVWGKEELALASSIAADILAGDPRGVADNQTSHALDLTIAALIAAEGLAPNQLPEWITKPADPVLRVNAAGIAAKIAGHDVAEAAVQALGTDEQMRQRYLTAVIHRACRIAWASAEQLASSRHIGHVLPEPAIGAIAAELEYRNDAGARWCAAFILADLWGDTADPEAGNALEQAIAQEQLPTLRTVYGRALGRRPLTS